MKNWNKSAGKAKRAFTLIELLTVVAIIAILAGLLFPAIKHALKQAEITQAKSDEKAIELAIRSYYTEYGKYPIPNEHQGQHFIAGSSTNDIYYGLGPGTSGCTGDSTINGLLPMQYDIIDTLRAISTPGHANTNNVLNPRQIHFLDIPSRKGAIVSAGTLTGTYLDPWGNPYYIKVDSDYDGIVSYYSFTNSSSLIVSYGPDGTTVGTCNACDPGGAKCDDVTTLK